MKNHLSKCPWVSGSDLTTRDGAVSTSEKVLHSCGCVLMQDGDKIGKKKKTDAGESLSMSPSDKHQRENKEASKGGLKCVEGRVLDMGGQNFPLFTPKR